MPIDYCSVCKVKAKDIANHHGIQCCSACETFFNTLKKREKPLGTCLYGDGLCWENRWKETEERPPNKSLCRCCRLSSFRKLGCQIVCNFENVATSSSGGTEDTTKRKRLQNHPQESATFSVDIQPKAPLSLATSQLHQQQECGNISRLVVELKEKCALPTFVQVQSGSQVKRYYSRQYVDSANDSRSPLKEDLDRIKDELHFIDLTRLINAVNKLDTHEVNEVQYKRNCVCGEDYSSWNNDRTDKYHHMFDFLIRIGWIDPIPKNEAVLNGLRICKQNRAFEAMGFAYLRNIRKLCPGEINMDILRTITQMPTLQNPSNCTYCGEVFDRNSTHVISNLLCLLGFTTPDELRQYSSCNCTYKHEPTIPPGLPIRARDLLDFLVFSGKFYVFGPKILPPNGFQHSKSTQCYLDCSQLGFHETEELADTLYCFVFCRRRKEELPTKGNANVCDSVGFGTISYFGTKHHCYVGLSTFSDRIFDHWYFVPISHRMQQARILLEGGTLAVHHDSGIQQTMLPAIIDSGDAGDLHHPSTSTKVVENDEYTLETPINSPEN